MVIFSLSFSLQFWRHFHISFDMYVNVVRLTTIIKSVSQKRSLCNISSAVLLYNAETGYTSVHSALSSMQNVTVQIQKYAPTQEHLSTVPFSCCQIIVQHRFERRETPQDQCQLRQSFIARLAIQPELYGTLYIKKLYQKVLQKCGRNRILTRHKIKIKNTYAFQ